MEQCKRQLVELKQRVFYNKPPENLTTTNINRNEQGQLPNETNEKFIQRKQLDSMAIQVARAEARYYQTDALFNVEYAKMKDIHLKMVKEKGMTTILNNLLDRRLENITTKFRAIYNYRTEFYLRTSYGDMQTMSSTTTKKNNDNQQKCAKNKGFYSFLLTNQAHQLTLEQVKLLNRGPTYVLPCQMYISNNASQSTEDILRKQFAPLQQQLASVFSQHYPHMILSWDMTTNIRQRFSAAFAMELPPADVLERATYEKRLVQSIRSSLVQNNLILRRTADHQNTFYLGNADEFEVQCTTTDDDNHAHQMKKQLNDQIENINHALGILKRRQALGKQVIERLQLHENQVQLPYLYFLPNVSKVRNSVSCLPCRTYLNFVLFIF